MNSIFSKLNKTLIITGTQTRRFNVISTPLYAAPTVAVVLSGCGVFDGSEIHEASATLVSLSRAKVKIQCYAPNESQMHVIDHSTGAPDESSERNVLAESARISRGNIKPLSELTSACADAVIFPGGFGAAKNLSDYGVHGDKMSVKPEVERVLQDFHTTKKPIGLCCIAPIIAAKVFGSKGVTLTVGKSDDGSGKWPYGGTVGVAKGFGANVSEKNVDEIEVDVANKIVTTPAFMYEGDFHEIHDGVSKMVKTVIDMIE